ncbi:hypothetical protein DFH11DRAFT_1583088 [Phellopilus nigrolimitatus]|nr:hypothetical protein DFH11DRAFT_1583088 [Phellopilus nigrolimitatus]
MATDGNNGDIAAQIDALFFMTLEKYCRFAATSLLVYDIIITFEKEVKYFWSSPRKLSSWIFFLNRYIGLFAAIVDTDTYFPTFNNSRSSRRFTKYNSCLFYAWTHQLADILLLRVLAFFSGDKRISRCLSALFVLEAVWMFSILLYIEISLKVGLAFQDGVSDCVNNGAFQQIWATVYWVVPLIFELVLLALVIHEATKFCRLSKGFHRSKLISVLVRDQVVYFFVVIACDIASLMSYWLDGGLFRGLVSGFSNASLLCVLGSRLLFNLHEVAERGLNGGSDTMLATMSDMRFQSVLRLESSGTRRF